MDGQETSIQAKQILLLDRKVTKKKVQIQKYHHASQLSKYKTHSYNYRLHCMEMATLAWTKQADKCKFLKMHTRYVSDTCRTGFEHDTAT